MLIVLVPRGATFIYIAKMPCLPNASGQYAINTLERITRNNRATHVMQYSVHVQNVESRVNLDPWHGHGDGMAMDTCVGCRIVEYLLSTVFYCVLARGCVGACFLL